MKTGTRKFIERLLKFGLYLWLLSYIHTASAQQTIADSTIPPQIEGWPLTGMDFFFSKIRVTDIDGDNVNEVFFARRNPDVLTCRIPNGALKENWNDIQIFGPYARMNPIFYDFNSDGVKEIMVQGWANDYGGGENLGIFDNHGNRLDDIWESTSIYDAQTSSNICLLDLLPRSIGPELILSYRDFAISSIRIYNTQKKLHELSSFELPFSGNYAWSDVSFLGGGDLDDDGVEEIVGIYEEYSGSSNCFYLFHLDLNNSIDPLWMIKIGGNLNPDPDVVIGDIDNDGFQEIVVASVPLWQPPALIMICNYDGTLIDTILVNDFISDIALADLDKDAKLEIICAAENSINVLTYDGNKYKNWPQYVYGQLSVIAVGDMDGDNVQEIILEKKGDVYIWHEDGTLMPGWPLKNQYPLQAGSLFLTDLDSDGDIDLLSISGYAVYAFDFSGTYNTRNIDWPMDKHDLYLTSMYGFNIPTNLKTDKNNTCVTDFYLYQNFPNPFNPITIIEYSIPKSQFVTIKIFDLLGREIVTLVNENKSIGHYKVRLDASNLSSGIYLYQIKAGKFIETKKLVLIK